MITSDDWKPFPIVSALGRARPFDEWCRHVSKQGEVFYGLMGKHASMMQPPPPLGLPGDRVVVLVREVREGVWLAHQLAQDGHVRSVVYTSWDDFFVEAGCLEVGATFVIEGVDVMVVGGVQVLTVAAPSERVAATKVFEKNRQGNKVVVDAFCGIGGWEHGCGVVTCDDLKGAQLVAIDHDLDALLTMKVNMGGDIYEKHELLAYVRRKGVLPDGPVLVHGKVQSRLWRSALCVAPCVQARFSPPCTSFSNAGYRKGLGNADWQMDSAS